MLFQLLICGCPKAHMMFLHWLSIFGKKVGCLNTLQLVYLKQFNIEANISKKFAIPFKTIWLDRKDPCLC